MGNPYLISTDKSRLDVSGIHYYLSKQSYWATGRSMAEVESSIENSLCFGLYTKNQSVDNKEAGRQIGFARVVTDKTVFAYLMDVLIFEEFEHQGYGTILMESILNSPDLHTVNWYLATQDAHGFYKKLGFNELENPLRFMARASLNNAVGSQAYRRVCHRDATS